MTQGMKTSTLALTVALLAQPVLAFADGGASSQMKTEAARYQRYFDGAHTALTSGGVAPHAELTASGGRISALLGGGKISYRAQVHSDGMVHEETATERHFTLGFGGSYTSGTSILAGKKGSSGKGMLKRSLEGDRSIRVLKAEGGAIGLDIPIVDVEKTSFGQPTAPQKSPMLLKLEQGRTLSAEAVKLAATDPQAARPALRQLDLLHREISEEKSSLNKLRADEARRTLAK